MKFLVVGLGNPGREYEMNRHNIGFRVAEAISRSGEGQFSPDRLGDSCMVKHRGRQIFLLKPNTYMNLSGKAVRYHLEKNNIDLKNLLVVTDDLALPLGKLRLRPKGSDGGHNGLKSVAEVLGTQDYLRLRFGVGSDFSKGGQVDYVLGDFSPEEEKLISPLLDKCVQLVHSWIMTGLDKTMSQFNS